MASNDEIRTLLDGVADVYSRRNWPGPVLLGKWCRDFAEVPLLEIEGALNAAMKASPQFPPTPMAVAALLDAPTSQGQAKAEPEGCPDCRRTPGKREMAIHHEDKRGAVVVREVMAACDCRDGMALLASTRVGQEEIPSRWMGWRDVWEGWQRRGALAVYVTHREHLTLDARERLTPEQVRAIRPLPASTHAARIRATLSGRDGAEWAWARARTLEADALREEMGDPSERMGGEA